jgi:hypothetical protein
MKNLSAVSLFVLTFTFTQFDVNGQRRLGPRPRPGQPTQPSVPTPTPAAAEGARQTAEQPATSAQSYKPAIEYQFFMEMRFYENQGGFLVEDLEVVFPPPGLKVATAPGSVFVDPRRRRYAFLCKALREDIKDPQSLAARLDVLSTLTTFCARLESTSFKS